MRGFIVAAVVLAAGIAAIGRADTGTETAEAVLGGDGVQRITVEGGSFYYRPDRIILKAGIPAELTFVKESGITPHNVVLHLEGSDVRIREDISTEGTVVRFTPMIPGTFPFFCDKKLLFFPDHRSKGMEGVLEIIE